MERAIDLILDGAKSTPSHSKSAPPRKSSKTHKFRRLAGAKSDEVA
jgi:hypothetical protein